MRRPYRLFLLIALLLVTSSVSRAAAQGNPAVLLVHTYGDDTPGRTLLDAAFVQELRDRTGSAFDLYIESLDTNRVLGERQQQLRDHLRQKYAGRQLAAVVAVYGLALNFLVEDDPPFPGVPIVATLTRRPEAVPPGVAFVWSGNVLRRTLETALRLHPGTRQITVIDGGPVRTTRDLLGNEIRTQVDEARGQVPATYLRDLPLEEVLTHVRALPRDSVILFSRQTLGRNGRPTSNPEAVREIAALATAPIYVTADPQLGTGAVGGVVISVVDTAVHLADLLVRVAAAGTAGIAPIEQNLSPTFDWRQLARWGIRESGLPPGSVVLHKQLTLWDQYRWYALAAMLVVSVQTALIAGLVVQRRRRRRTQLALRDSEQQLRGAYEQNRDLAGRLINAQETERARIARELHDDVSQQLAGLGIMISSLKHGAGRPDAASETAATIANLQERTSTLAKTVRGLSHELHPSVLQHAGLIATLRHHCTDVATQRGVAVNLSAPDELAVTNPDISLCLFRVAQEALANAVRHGQAREINVSLSLSAGIELRIDDDGLGFNAVSTRRGLGLRSIDERVRLLGGEVRVQSQPRRGTSVTVILPEHALTT